ncbi:MAG: hypothetical protein K0R14_461 [Burkholderiales bacterium]|jgi:hypothetical protein|nr:hypothetical protein [Burkholderiales bacterium]
MIKLDNIMQKFSKILIAGVRAINFRLKEQDYIGLKARDN